MSAETVKQADIFRYTDYRAYLKARVKSEKSNWGLWAKLARAAACQPTYLSQAVKGKVHLTADHLIAIAQYWELSESETDYFLLMLDYARAGTKNLKIHVEKKMNRLREEREDISKRLEIPTLESNAKESFYYSAWYWSALHMIVSIPEYTTVQAISKRLMLPPDFVEHALKQLEKSGIVKYQGAKWGLGTADLHIPKDSMMIGMHHNNWRQRAVTDSAMPNNGSVHYTGIYSISRTDAQHLKEKMIDLIEHSRKVLRPSKEEDLICFSCDLFRI